MSKDDAGRPFGEFTFQLEGPDFRGQMTVKVTDIDALGEGTCPAKVAKRSLHRALKAAATAAGEDGPDAE
ncbi:hypothetical protein [Roseibium sp. TrichSKD4]|uniref:hypothetical protein n=1 Tax=Roseibium sp. TrichSKD4 TaxID=744980 RepID=UPI00111248D4|nr:hypothetical protein [Roseibium sp. TrichSKD4]